MAFTRRTVLRAGGAAGIAGIAGCTQSLTGGGSDFPNRDPEFITIGSPGSTFDGYMRLLANELSGRLEVNVRPNNMPGGAGRVGAEYVYNTVQPNGYTCGLLNPSSLTRHQLTTDVGYELQEFSWLPRATQNMGSIGVSPDSGISSFSDFVDEYQAGNLNIGTTGPTGSAATYLAMLAELGGVIDLEPLLENQVVFGSTPEIVQAMQAGEVDAIPIHLVNLYPYHVDGTLDIIFVYTMDEIPEFAREGVSDDVDKLGEVDVDNAQQIANSVNYQRTWATSPDVPEDRVEWWRETITEVYQDEEFRQHSMEANYPVVTATAEEVQQINEDLLNTWGEHIDLLDRMQQGA